MTELKNDTVKMNESTCKNCIHVQQYLDLSASIIHRHLLNKISEESRKNIILENIY